MSVSYVEESVSCKVCVWCRRPQTGARLPPSPSTWRIFFWGGGHRFRCLPPSVCDADADGGCGCGGGGGGGGGYHVYVMAVVVVVVVMRFFPF